ncbi:MAG: glycosyltransferase family 39 protein [Elainellaceae cyanobacterium]
MVRLTQSPMRWFRLWIITLVILGIFFRIVNLDQKVYWRDEALTSLRISGYTVVQVIDQTFGGQTVSLDDLQTFQRLSPTAKPLETIYTIARDNPHHPPLYFLITQYWAKWFGDSASALRSLSVLFSLASLFLMYWLCRELFANSHVAEVAIALFAVSPFQLLYAQEARPYSLWIATILLSSTLLLRALRFSTALSWIAYAVSVVLGLYTALFSVFIVIGHCLYVLITERCRLTARLKAFLIASGASLAAFLPWLIVVKQNISQINESTSWVNQTISLPTQIKIWLLNGVRIFFDIDFKLGNPLGFFAILIVVLIPFSLYFLWRYSRENAYLFVLCLIGVTACVLVGSDGLFGGVRSVTARYVIPCILGIQIAVAHLLATQCTVPSPLFSPLFKQHQFWKTITALVLSLGLLSSAMISQADSWWNKYSDEYNFVVSDIVNESPNSVLMSFSGSVGQILSLSHSLNSNVKLRLFMNSEVKHLPDDPGTIFLLNPSKDLRDHLRQEEGYQVENIHQPGNLWRLER